jgi:nicotinamide phosphoribosyltransferase
MNNHMTTSAPLLDNIILLTDSYKSSHYLQYPPNTTKVYSYIESRKGESDVTLFFGLQYFIKRYLLNPITQQHIDIAEAIITQHGEPFYRKGWEYILEKHNGYLPLQIKARRQCGAHSKCADYHREY